MIFYIVVDIETNSGTRKPSIKDVKVPTNYGQEAAEKYIAKQIPELYAKQALNHLRGGISCIGYKIYPYNLNKKELLVPEASEVTVIPFSNNTMELLQIFVRSIVNGVSYMKTKLSDPDKLHSLNINDDVIWVGVNTQFDIKFLTANSIKELGYTITPNNIRSSNIIDLSAIANLHEYKAYTSKDELCDWLGIENEDTTTGSEMVELYNQGKMDEIVKHCRFDVHVESLIFERLFPLIN